jgi:predicted dehydrogenase
MEAVMDEKGQAREYGSRVDRRTFLWRAGVVGAGLMLAPTGFAQEDERAESDYINVGLIGLGEQCARLVDAMTKAQMPKKEKLRFAAVCDIWPYRLAGTSRRLAAYKHEAKAYDDYEKMLAEEKGLDAVIIATPDWMHAPITVACLKAGLHVYCEKEMSNSIEDAKKMVQAARETGKLLQIGHQRRSNPRYIAAKRLIDEYRVLGKIKNISGQWNRGVDGHKLELPAKKIWMEEECLKRRGYGSMDELMNWRWYEKFGGGPLGDLGSHQIDIYNWFLGEEKPRAILASGGKDYYRYQQNEDVMAIYEYESKRYGNVRAFYQVLNTTSYGTYGPDFEVFMGDQGVLMISEMTFKIRNSGWALREKYTRGNPDVEGRWNKAIRDKMIGAVHVPPGDEQLREILEKWAILRLVSSVEEKGLQAHPMLAELDENTMIHQPHLQNFFDAVRGKAKLNCPGEAAYETAVTVLKANEAIKEDKKVKFTEGDFAV